jgi:hypothetical protein
MVSESEYHWVVCITSASAPRKFQFKRAKLAPDRIPQPQGVLESIRQGGAGQYSNRPRHWPRTRFCPRRNDGFCRGGPRHRCPERRRFCRSCARCQRSPAEGTGCWPRIWWAAETTARASLVTTFKQTAGGSLGAARPPSLNTSLLQSLSSGSATPPAFSVAFIHATCLLALSPSGLLAGVAFLLLMFRVAQLP